MGTAMRSSFGAAIFVYCGVEEGVVCSQVRNMVALREQTEQTPRSLMVGLRSEDDSRELIRKSFSMLKNFI
jgi:hypothetical protein